jgi:hypothetical protein
VVEACGLEDLNRPVSYLVEKSTKSLAQPLGSLFCGFAWYLAALRHFW